MSHPLVCIDCYSPLSTDAGSAHCASCGAVYPVEHEIVDFASGHYYDSFDPERDELATEHLKGLQLELEGSIRRISDFYLPVIRRVAPGSERVLDVGCGNGVSVDTLRDAGLDAWGNDLSELRKYQWREREHRDRLVVASALQMPFPDEYFDIVISSGVLEHIGVVETPSPNYSVRATEDQHELRVAFLKEIARILRPRGHVFMDFPNGRFPVDFWHGNSPGSPRFHTLTEPFLPSFGEIQDLASSAMNAESVTALSPHRRLQFKQSASHFHGRVFRLPFAVLFRAMEKPGLRWLARSPINPFLVVQITKTGPTTRPTDQHST